MKLAVTGTVYNIEPISGINNIIDRFTNLFRFKKPKCIACSWTYNISVIERLSNITDCVRIFIGKGQQGKFRGALLSMSHTHCKIIYMWDNEKTAVYLGSNNLVDTVGYSDYGIFVIMNNTNDGFDLNINIDKYYEWNDPFYVIITDIISRFTGCKCEVCRKPTEILYLNKNAKFVCERCYK